MAMQVGEAASDDEMLSTINTTPLVDVMLVLLIMLIITIPIQTHAVKLDMPAGNPPTQLVQPEMVRIDVDFDGTVVWNGQVVEGRTALETRLAGAAAQPVQPEVHLRAHKLANYRHVAAVLASAQRQGVSKIGLIGNEQFLE